MSIKTNCRKSLKLSKMEFKKIWKNASVKNIKEKIHSVKKFQKKNEMFLKMQ